jgi:hypothetical protein
MPHCVHARVYRVKAPGPDASLDRIRVDLEPKELSPTNDPVLSPRQLGDHAIGLRFGAYSASECRRSGHETEADGEMRTRGARFGESLLRAGALDDGFGGCRLGLADRGPFEGVGQGPQVGAGACLDDVGGDAGA